MVYVTRLPLARRVVVGYSSYISKEGNTEKGVTMNMDHVFVLHTVKALEEYKVMKGTTYAADIIKMNDNLWLIIRPNRKAQEAESLRIAYQWVKTFM